MAASDTTLPVLSVAQVSLEDVEDGQVITCTRADLSAHEVAITVTGMGGNRHASLTIGKVDRGFVSTSITAVAESGDLEATGDGSVTFKFTSLEAGVEFEIGGKTRGLEGVPAVTLKPLRVTTNTEEQHSTHVVAELRREVRVLKAKLAAGGGGASLSALAALRDELSAANARLAEVEARARREESAKEEALAREKDALAKADVTKGHARQMLTDLTQANARMVEFQQARAAVTASLAGLVSGEASEDAPATELIEKLTSQQQDLVAQLKASQARCADLEGAVVAAKSAVSTSAAAEAAGLQEKLDAVLGELETTQGQLATVSAALEKAQSEVANHAAQAEAAATAQAATQQALQEKTAEVEGANGIIAALQQELEGAADAGAKAAEVEALQAKLDAQRDEQLDAIAELEGRVFARQEEARLAKEQAQELQGDEEATATILQGVLVALGSTPVADDSMSLVQELQGALATVMQAAAAPTTPEGSPGLLKLLTDLRDQRDAARQDIVREQEAVGGLAAELAEAKADLKDVRAALDASEARTAKLMDASVSATAAISRAEGLQREVAQLKRDVGDMATKAGQADRRAEASLEELLQARSVLDETEDRARTAEAELARATASAAEVGALTAIIAQLRETLAASEAQEEAQEAELGQVQASLDQALAAATSSAAELVAAQDEVASLQEATRSMGDKDSARAFRAEVEDRAAKDGRVDAVAVESLCYITHASISTVIDTLHRCGGNQGEVVQALVTPPSPPSGAPMSGGGTGGQ